MSSKPTKEFLDSAVYLVDSSSYIFRAYYAIRAGLTAPDGTPTHATYGFSQMVLSLLDGYKPHHCVFIWDHKDKGFRHEIFNEYKANRSAPPDDLGIQIDNSKRFLNVLALPQLDKSGFEADDIIATLVRKNPTTNFVIVTGDKDLLQLVNDHVWCLDTMKQKWLGRLEAIEKFGVEPEKIVLVQALSGDSVDNIPGAPGIGPKTATDLINYFGSLEAIFEAARVRQKDEALVKKLPKEDPLKGKKIESIAQNIPQVEMSLKLVQLSFDAPVESNPDSFHQGKVEPQIVQEFCQSLGFERMKDKILAQSNTSHRNAETSSAENLSSKSSRSASEAQLDPASGVIDSETVSDPLSNQHTRRVFKTRILDEADSLETYFQENKAALKICLDTETASLDSRAPNNLVGVSLSVNHEEGVYIPVAHVHGLNLSISSLKEQLQKFLEALPSGASVIFQNAKFDLHVLSAAGINIPKHLIIEDTMLESFVLDPTENHGMDELSVKYLDGYRPMSFEEVTKGVENFSQVPIDEAAFYSGEDAVVTFALHDVLSAKLKTDSQTLSKVYEKLDRPLLPILFKMEETGVHLDCERLSDLSTEWSRELLDLEQKSLGMLSESGVDVADDFNLASPKQIANVLFEKLGLPVIKKTKTGASTDVSVLEELATVHPFPKALLEIRELQKLISTYVDSLPQLLDPQTKRIHTDISQTVAATGRLASSRPNLQNIPIRSERGKKIREAFSASPGKVLLGVDYSQIELRLLAHYSRDRNLVLAFREGADIHRRTASLILGKDEEKITSDERRMAKTINFGIIYGQTAFGLSKQLGISRGEAQKFIASYMDTYPGIAEFTTESVAKARKNFFSETLAGRRRPIPDINTKNVPTRLFAERVAVNTPLQGTAADLIKAAMICVDHKVLPRFGSAQMILQVHDELLFEVSVDESESLKKEVVSVMEDPKLLKDFGVEGFEVLMKAEASIGKNWGVLK